MSKGPWKPRDGNPIQVPDEMLQLGFDALAHRIESTGSVAGAKLVTQQRAAIESASCGPCQRRTAEARLRVWLVKNGASEQ